MSTIFASASKKVPLLTLKTFIFLISYVFFTAVNSFSTNSNPTYSIHLILNHLRICTDSSQTNHFKSRSHHFVIITNAIPVVITLYIIRFRPSSNSTTLLTRVKLAFTWIRSKLGNISSNFNSYQRMKSINDYISSYSITTRMHQCTYNMIILNYDNCINVKYT